MAIVLASASSIRRSLLQAAGVAVEMLPADVDETDLKQCHQGNDADLAGTLAIAKACQVSRTRPDDWVIGGDSVVSVDGRRFSKPKDRDAAAEHLRFFSGKQMHLTSAVCLARAGRADWQHVSEAKLQLRSLSESFIADYLDQEWPEVGYCVGVFRLEGRGVNLFEAIDGDHFTILGLPLLPLLGALRDRDLMPS